MARVRLANLNGPKWASSGSLLVLRMLKSDSEYPLSQNDCRQEKLFSNSFGGSTGKSCKSPGGYYIIKFLGNYFSHPVRASVVLGQRPGGALTGQGLLQEKMFGEFFFGGST